MRFWILTSSVLAIAGGVLFLVLPIAFLNGTVSVIQPPPPPPPPCKNGYCQIIDIYRPISLPVEMFSFLGILGGLGILLAVLILVMRMKPRGYLTWGVPFSLESESLLLSIVTLYIQGNYVVSPMIYSLFLSIATIAMVGSTLLLTFGLAMSNYPRTIDDDKSPQKRDISLEEEETLSVPAWSRDYFDSRSGCSGRFPNSRSRNPLFFSTYSSLG